MQDQRVISVAAVVDVKTPPAENLSVDKIHGRNGSLKRMTSPITATSYTVATLQTATSSFSQENIVGEGSLGRVYRAVFSNGKVSPRISGFLSVVLADLRVLVSRLSKSELVLLHASFKSHSTCLWKRIVLLIMFLWLERSKFPPDHFLTLRVLHLPLECTNF